MRLAVTTLLALIASASGDSFRKIPRCESIPKERISMDHEVSYDVPFFAKDLCYYHEAKNRANTAPCRAIGSEILNGSCVQAVAIAKKDSKICDQVAGNRRFPASKRHHRDSCYLEFAIKFLDAEVCKSIQMDKENCFSVVNARKNSPPP